MFRVFNLFVAYTSYNVLLSFAVAASHPDDDNFMILAGNTKSLVKITETLLNIAPANNMRYFSFEKSKGCCNLSSFFVKKHNLHILADKVKSFPRIDRIFYGCEWSVYTTYSVYLVQTINSEADFLFLDDGIFTYANAKLTLKNYIERIADKFFYGTWHINTAKYGALKHNGFMCALFPNLLPNEHKKKKHYTIDINAFLEQISDEKLIIETSTAQIDNIEVLFATDYRWMDFNKNIIERILDCSDNNMRVAIKRHPADNGKISFTPPECNNVYELKSTIPVELYYLRYRKTLKKIVGGVSTSLLMARKMLPDAEITAIVFSDSLKDNNTVRVIDFYKKIGITISIINV